MRKSISYIAVPTLLALLPMTASAHPLLNAGFGLGSGFGHPFSGLDHLLAMIAVGLWAIQTGGRAVWMVPLAFVSVMLLGGVVAYSGVPLPFVEQGIGVSVIFLGLLILSATTLSPVASAAIVAFFALFHGYAHGSELPHMGVALSYSAGFALATAALHLSGIAAGHWLMQGRGRYLLRYMGAAIALGGVSLFAL